MGLVALGQRMIDGRASRMTDAAERRALARRAGWILLRAAAVAAGSALAFAAVP